MSAALRDLLCVVVIGASLLPGPARAAPGEVAGEAFGDPEAPAEVPEGDAPAEVPEGDAPAEVPEGDAPVEAPVASEPPAPVLDTRDALDRDQLAGDTFEADDADEADDGDLDRDEAPLYDDYDPIRDSPEAAVARRWLSAGIAATIAGGVLVGSAIALSQTAPCDPLAGNNCFVEARNRAALTMGIPGAVLLLGGVAMTSVGALQRKRLWTSLAFGRADVGVVVGGRF